MLKNLGKTGPIAWTAGTRGPACFNKFVHATKQDLHARLMKMLWNPAEERRERMLEAYRELPLGPRRVFERSVESKAKVHDLRVHLAKEEIKTALQPLVKWQMDGALKGSAEQMQSLESLYREVRDDDVIDLICRLKDEEPMARWMAIKVAERRWEGVENFLVELLDDPAPQVRQAAHQALVKLSRGNDFGPSGAAPTTSAIRTAQKHWRAYLDLQER